MYAIGFITDRKDAIGGNSIVSLFFQHPDEGTAKWYDYSLANKSSVPEYWPEFGLFYFELEDQFCYWRNPQELLINP